MIIRPYSPADAGAAHAAAVESWREVEPWMPWCTRDYTAETANQWIALCEKTLREKTAFEFAAFDDRGEFIGGCGLNQFDLLNKRANRLLDTDVGGGTRLRDRSSSHARAVGESEHRLSAHGGSRGDRQRSEPARRGEIGRGARAVLKSRILLHGKFHDAVMHAFIRGTNF